MALNHFPEKNASGKTLISIPQTTGNKIITKAVINTDPNRLSHMPAFIICGMLT